MAVHKINSLAAASVALTTTSLNSKAADATLINAAAASNFDNSVFRFTRFKCFMVLKIGAAGTAFGAGYVGLIRDDQGTPNYSTGNYSGVTSAFTAKNAQHLGSFTNANKVNINDLVYFNFEIYRPGIEFSVFVAQSFALLAPSGSYIRLQGFNREIQ